MNLKDNQVETMTGKQYETQINQEFVIPQHDAINLPALIERNEPLIWLTCFNLETDSNYFKTPCIITKPQEFTSAFD